MHAFTKPSNQLRLKVLAATLKSLHYTSLNIHMFINAKAQGPRTVSVGTSLQSMIQNSQRDGITILKFIYDQL